MKKKPFFLRTVAVFLIFTVLNAVFFPSVSLALSLGPNQVEYLSYEQFGNTDLVNLSTGDFVYNIPLLSIPGPEGNFSIPLSYHAGISPEAEASWVGLGWSLNPGALTRDVNQFPDDFTGEVLSSHKKDAGGSGYSINFLLGNYNYDSEKGSGGMISLLGLADVGYGNQKGDVNVMGVNMTTLDASALGMASSLISLVSLGSASFAASSLAGALNTGMFLAGVYQYNKALNAMSDNFRKYQMQSKINGFLFYTKYKYWIDDDQNEPMYGSLYFNKLNQLKIPVSEGFKSRTALYVTTNGTPINCGSHLTLTNLIPNYVTSDMHMSSVGSENKSIVNPTSICYDQYSIKGEGISGTIMPYRTDVGSLLYPIKLDHYSKFYPVAFKDYKVKYRFDGDYSNYYSYHIGKTSVGELPNNQQPDYNISYTSCNNAIIDFRDPVLYDDNFKVEPNREGMVDGKLIQGRNVEWYSNEEISNNSASMNGFVDFLKENPTDGSEKRSTFRNGLNVPKGIGGYSVTATNGVTYHYALPVYNLKQYFYSQTSNTNHQDTKMSDKFAYQWLLTAITGPDYVDRPGEGLGVVDESDWGYWVKLDYGKFSSNYQWRNPYWNFAPSGSYSYSEGLKETYYLNTISTRSHTGIFIKDLRKDGRGAYARSGSDVLSQELGSGTTPYNGSLPSSSLSLNEIIVMSNSDYKALKLGGLKTNNTNNYKVKADDNFDNIYDTQDITSLRSQINEKQTTRLAFDFDYSLCKKTLNSFPAEEQSNFDALNPPREADPIDGTRGGKLTLKKVNFYGVNNVQLTPDYNFEYNGINPDYKENATDVWGMYLNPTNTSVANYQEDCKAWSLTKINTPIGGYVEIDYERDAYSAVNGINNTTTLIPVFGTQNLFESYNLYDELAKTYKVGSTIGFTQQTVCSPDYTLDENPGIATVISASGNRIQTTPPTFDTPRNPNCTATTNNHVSAQPWVSRLGGNLRVKEIRASDGIVGNEVYKTRYVYSLDGNPSTKSSGFITQDPSKPKSELYDLPSTPILYEKITVYNGRFTTDEDYVKRQEYNFVNYNGGMVLLNKSEYHTDTRELESDFGVPTLHSYQHVNSRNFIIDIKKDAIGAIASINNYDNKNNIISSTKFNYNSNITGQGFFTEGSFYGDASLTEPDHNTQEFWYRFSRTTKRFFPNILESVTTTNNGVTSTVKNTKYDFYTGEVIQKEFENSFGQNFTSLSVPAYTKYPEMGPKALSKNNVNMMGQLAGQYFYKGSGTFGPVLGASVQTWDNNWMVKNFDISTSSNNLEEPNKVWRPKSTYSWNSAEIYSDGSFKNFVDYWNSPNNPKWLKTSEITLHNEFSKSIETQNVNGIFSSTRYGHDKKMPTSAVLNSNYVSATYSSFENIDKSSNNLCFDGDILIGNSVMLAPTNFSPHSGKYVASLNGNSNGPTFYASNFAGNNVSGKELLVGRKYRATAWVHNTSAQTVKLEAYLNGSTSGGTVNKTWDTDMSKAIATVAGWKLLVLDFDVPGGYKSSNNNGLTVRISNPGPGLAYVDDFRLHPYDANMISSAYDEKTGQITHALDEDNYFTKYVYDSRNRLKEVYKENSKGVFKVKEYNYNDKRK